MVQLADLAIVPQSPLSNPSNGAPRFPFFGSTTFWDFTDTITSSATTFSIGTVYSETINTRLFIIPSLSFKDPGLGSRILVRAAVCIPHHTSLPDLSLTKTVTNLALLHRRYLDSNDVLLYHFHRNDFARLSQDDCHADQAEGHRCIHDLLGSSHKRLRARGQWGYLSSC